LSGSAAFHVPKLLFTLRFVRRFPLSKIGAFSASRSVSASRSARSAGFHVPKLLLAKCFSLRFGLTKISGGCRLFLRRRLTPAKEAA
jgi:hypothetical protein